MLLMMMMVEKTLILFVLHENNVSVSVSWKISRLPCGATMLPTSHRYILIHKIILSSTAKISVLLRRINFPLRDWKAHVGHERHTPSLFLSETFQRAEVFRNPLMFIFTILHQHLPTWNEFSSPHISSRFIKRCPNHRTTGMISTFWRPRIFFFFPDKFGVEITAACCR